MIRVPLGTLVLVATLASAAEPIFLSDSALHAIDGSLYSGQATVYVIRDSSRSGSLWPIAIKVDGKEQGTLRRESYVFFPVAPGRHDIWSHWNPLSGEPDVAVNVEFAGDKTYYLLFSTSFYAAGHMMQTHASFGLVDRSTGEAMVGRYKKVDAVGGQ